MRYLIVAAVVAAGLFVTTGTASAQHYGGQHGGAYAHGGHGTTNGIYVAPRVGVSSHTVPSYGYSQSGYGVGVYSRPSYSVSGHGGGYAGHGYDRHDAHHYRHGHR